MTRTPREYLELARSHLDRVQSAAWDPVDWADIGNYGLYALEAAVMAATKALNVDVQPSHWSKSDAAELLVKEHGLPEVGSLMRDLNDARKASNYGDIARPERLDAEDVAAIVEEFVTEVESTITAAEANDEAD